ncbi:MAG: MarR family transcriptional regulator [Cyclobacteriaceae bacterium]
MNQDYLGAIDQIIRTGHWITDQVSAELKEFDISEPQYNVLRVLKVRSGEPITVQKIQDKMVQRTSNVTRIIDKLLDKGLVNRKECPSNRRKMDITITAMGEELLSQLNAKVIDFHQPMSKNLSTEEAQQLKSLIIKLKGTDRS